MDTYEECALTLAQEFETKFSAVLVHPTRIIERAQTYLDFLRNARPSGTGTEPESSSSPTPRDIAILTFFAVAALAKRMTGDDVCVTMQCADGLARSLTGNELAVTWLTRGSPRVPSPEALKAAARIPLEEFSRAHRAGARPAG